MSAYRKLLQICATTYTRNCKTSIYFLRIFQRDLDCYRRNIKRHCCGSVWPVDHEYFLRQHDAPYRWQIKILYIRRHTNMIAIFRRLPAARVVSCSRFFCFISYSVPSCLFHIVYRMTVSIQLLENFSYFSVLIISQNYFKNIIILLYYVFFTFGNKNKNYYLLNASNEKLL